MIKAAWGEDGGCSAPARNGKKGFGMQGMGSDPAGAPSLLPVSYRQELQQPLGYLWGQKPPQPLSGVGRFGGSVPASLEQVWEQGREAAGQRVRDGTRTGTRSAQGDSGRWWLCVPGAEHWGNGGSSSTSCGVLGKPWHGGSQQSRQGLTAAAFTGSVETPARKQEQVSKHP